MKRVIKSIAFDAAYTLITYLAITAIENCLNRRRGFKRISK